VIRKQQTIVLVLVAALALGGAVACICCPTGAPVVSTPVVQRPTEAPGVPTRPPEPTGPVEPTKPAVEPTRLPEPTAPAEQPAAPLGSTPITSLRFLAEIKDDKGETMTLEGERTPTAMHFKVTTVKADGTKEEQELYYVDKYMYMKDQDGKWQKIEVGAMPAETVEAFDFNKLLKEAQDKGELELKGVGPAVVRGVACMKYQFVMKDPKNKGEGAVYLGLTDGLIYRMEGQSTNSEGVTSNVVYEAWDYNKDFTIQPPI